MSRQEELALVLYQALGEPIGLLLSCEDAPRARQALYQARSKIGDEDLGRLQIRLVEGMEGGNLALVKGAALPEVRYEPPKGDDESTSSRSNLTAKDLDL